MSSLFYSLRRAGGGWVALLIWPLLLPAHAAFIRQGEEYPLAGLLRGDQMHPHLSVAPSGGYLVWQDNATDGDGLGISARRLGGGLAGNMGVFRVNEQGVGDQERPRVALTAAGGAVFVWQGGDLGQQNIYARFIGAEGTFISGDILVNTYTQNQQRFPVVTILEDDRVLVVWSSHGQDGSLEGVYGQRFSNTGRRIGPEFQINQFTPYNQRHPSLAALSNGEFAVAWVSENQRFQQSVDIIARRFHSNGEPASNEFLVNTSTNLCANPVISARAEGGFLIGWSQLNIGNLDQGWDVFLRSFDAAGQPLDAPIRVNTHLPGHQYAPKLAAIGDTHLVVWTSDGQDDSREGVFGRFVASDGTPISAEFRVNTATANRQIYPAVASDGLNQFLVAWSGYVGLPFGFDLLGQRYAMSPLVPSAPFVSAVSPSRLSVTWPLAGTNTVAGYEVFVNGSPTPVTLSGNVYSLGSLAPASTHSFRLAYWFSNGDRSPLSTAGTGTTWGSDENLDGLPDDWQAQYWGEDPAQWPDPREDSDGDGASNLDEFLAGTDPTDPESVLRLQMKHTSQGTFLTWNSQPGLVYQVQIKEEVSGEWENLGWPRFAVGSQDSMLLEAAGPSIYYRIQRLR